MGLDTRFLGFHVEAAVTSHHGAWNNLPCLPHPLRSLLRIEVRTGSQHKICSCLNRRRCLGDHHGPKHTETAGGHKSCSSLAETAVPAQATASSLSSGQEASCRTARKREQCPRSPQSRAACSVRPTRACPAAHGEPANALPRALRSVSDAVAANSYWRTRSPERWAGTCRDARVRRAVSRRPCRRLRKTTGRPALAIRRPR